MFHSQSLSNWRRRLLSPVVATAVAFIALVPASGPSAAQAASGASVQDLTQCMLPCARVISTFHEVIEGHSGTRLAQIQVGLTHPSTQPVTVGYTTNNSVWSTPATAGVDYRATSGTLSFLPGETVKTISVDVIGDLATEPIEHFQVDLTEATNAVVYGHGATVSIWDDDTLIRVTDRAMLEGDGGTRSFAFTVSLSRYTSKDVTVRYTTANGSATAGSDYVGSSGTLIFPMGYGIVSQTVVVPVKGDVNVERDETFYLNLSQPTNARIADGQGRGTIRNDDVLGPEPCPITVPDCEQQ